MLIENTVERRFVTFACEKHYTNNFYWSPISLNRRIKVKNGGKCWYNKPLAISYSASFLLLLSWMHVVDRTAQYSILLLL